MLPLLPKTCAVLFGLGALLCQQGCTPAASSDGSNPSELAKEAVAHPLPPEKAKEMLGDAGENWLYGNGIGETAFAVGTIVVFPLAAIYWVGNAALSVSGYETVGVSTVLPEDERAQWNGFYDDVSGAPGRVSAAVAGREFITREQAKERLMKYMPIVKPTSIKAEEVSAP